MLDLILSAIQAILQVMIVVAFGSILAKYGYFNNDKQKWLSRVNMVFFTPCLLFSNIASIISFSKLLAFWPIPVFYLVCAVLNYTSSQIVSRLVGLTPAYRRFVQACVMFSNSNSLPIAIITSLAVSDAVDILQWTSDDTSEAIAARGISYTLFFAIFGNLIRWSYGYQLLRNYDDEEVVLEDEEHAHDDDHTRNKANYHSFNSQTTSPTLSTTHSHSDSETHPETHHVKTMAANESTHLLPTPSPNLSKSADTSSILGFFKKIAKTIHGFMSPPLYAATLALIVGLSPLKPLMYDKDSFLYPSLTKAIESCGRAAVPLILTCLGAQLVSISQLSHHEDSHSMKKPVATAILVRMVLMPLLIIPLVVLFAMYGSHWSTLATDPVFITMMIVLGSTPTAINLVQITQVNNVFEEEMLKMLFWSYGVVCVPACTIVVFVALSIVEKIL